MTTPQGRLLKLAEEAINEYNAAHGAGGEADFPSWVEDVRQLCATLPAPPASAQDEKMREGYPHDDPEFVALCREHAILGTAMQGLAAMFWRGASAQNDAKDERQAFEAWAKKKKMPLARIGQQYDDFWVDHAWNGWQARARIDAPAAGDARDARRYRALIWVCTQGFDTLEVVCKAAGVHEDISPERLEAIADAAIAAQRQGDA